MKKIDITKQDIRCCDDFDIVNDGNELSANIPYELWFDVDKYFGTKTKDSDKTVHFYTFYYKGGKIKAFYGVESSTDNKYHEWKLSTKEEAFFKKMMEDYCNYKCGCSLELLLEKYEQ